MSDDTQPSASGRRCSTSDDTQRSTLDRMDPLHLAAERLSACDQEELHV
ncbi:MAG TPA: hypothetical protein VMT31_06460 [Methanomicrobiales archaeon]|nr:hypothetical protein [Methanomicrobiales archaeon]